MSSWQGSAPVAQHSYSPSLPPEPTRAVSNQERHWLFPLLLHTCTFGIYTCFWLVGTLRRIRAIREVKVVPWLWFFVPGVVIAQFFALPRLAGHVEEMEKQFGLPTWGAEKTPWVLLVVAVSVLFTIGSRVGWPLWSDLFLILVWGFAFTYLEQRLKPIWRAAARYENAPKLPSRSLRWWEWLMLVPSVPFTLVFIPYLSVDSLGFNDVSSIEVGVYEDPQGRFSLPVTQSGWHQVSEGTFSEDANLLELRGPVEGMFGVVYEYQDFTVDELMDSRISEVGAITRSGIPCTEKRGLVPGTVRVQAEFLCEGTGVGTRFLIAGKIVETETGLSELIINLENHHMVIGRWRDDVKQMTGGFSAR